MLPYLSTAFAIVKLILDDIYLHFTISYDRYTLSALNLLNFNIIENMFNDYFSSKMGIMEIALIYYVIAYALYYLTITCL